MNWIEEKIKHLEAEMEKQTKRVPHIYRRSHYKDSKWDYEADSEKGVRISLVCSCGQEHSIKLDKNMAVLEKEEIIDIEPTLISYDDLAKEVGFEGQNSNIGAQDVTDTSNETETNRDSGDDK